MATISLFRYFLLFLLCFTSTVFALSCYRCKEDCAKGNIPLVPCGENETHCVTYEIDRYSVIRDCFQDSKLNYECSLENQALMKCSKCNTDGCNMDFQEPLICRVCDWTFESSCPRRQRCHIPFGTHHVRCYIVYSRLRGYNYGCNYEAPADVEEIISKDRFRILHMTCDAHDCNDAVRFLAGDKMFEPYRICTKCGICPKCGTGRCGLTICKNPYSDYGMFCYREDFDYNVGCLGDLSEAEVAKLFDGRRVVICAESWCNTNIEPTLHCHDQQGYPRFCFQKNERCVSFTEDNGKTFPLGCLFNSPCFDKKRCYFCDRDACNDLTVHSHITMCYKCGERDETGCKRIRTGQTSYISSCYKSNCTWITNEKREIRDCSSRPRPPDFKWSIDCEGDLCNDRPTTAICYACNENSRECIFSQEQMNFVSCKPGEDSCFVTDKGDGRVERGCGVGSENYAKVCSNVSLCNGESTVSHACHIFETDFDFHINLEPPVIGTKFMMGWTPDVCADIDGRPACYMSYHKDGMVWGCLGDLRNYKEEYFGAEPSDTFLSCEGHYCNYLP